jgi:hypothetical protein
MFTCLAHCAVARDLPVLRMCGSVLITGVEHAFEHTVRRLSVIVFFVHQCSACAVTLFHRFRPCAEVACVGVAQKMAADGFPSSGRNILEPSLKNNAVNSRVDSGSKILT